MKVIENEQARVVAFEKSEHSPMLDRCRRGDSDGWAQMLRDYGSLVQSVARRVGLTPEQCDDVYQETFILLFQNLSKLRTDATLCKWLMVATSRLAFRARKKSRREVFLDSEMDIAVPNFEEGLLERLANDSRQVEISRALEHLQPDHRKLMHLLFFEHKNYIATAEAMGLSMGSVGPIRGRSLKRLAIYLAPDIAA